MLSRLFITNYALIDTIELNLTPGLTIITGETGAGKSIILGALSLLLGQKADARSVRDPQRKTVVEATFDIAAYGLQPFFTEHDIDYDEHECLLRREVSAAGRSRAFINDTPVQLPVLRELATQLVDIHSQHSNMLLAKPQYQLTILDAIAHDAPLLAQYATAYNAYRHADAALQQAIADYEQARADEDYTRFQFTQLDELQLRPGEEAELEAQQLRLANVGEIKEILNSVGYGLQGDESEYAQDSIMERLDNFVHEMSKLEGKLVEATEFKQRLRSASIDLRDLCTTLINLADSIDDDPSLLEQVEQRQHAIYDLKRKHNVDSVEALIALHDTLKERLGSIEGGEEHINELREQVETLRAQALDLAQQLSTKRHEAAQQFEQQLVAQAHRLGLKNMVGHIDFTTVEMGPTGADAVELLLAFNRNQQPMPVRDTASGGEISRVMLCIKHIVAQSMQLPTLILDEVDTGVSGEVAGMMGEMMAAVARNIQVITITHLPQVAAHGTAHLKVYKTDTAQSTITHVDLLDDEQHVMEIARMLSGKQLGQEAIANARALINSCNPKSAS